LSQRLKTKDNLGESGSHEAMRLQAKAVIVIGPFHGFLMDQLFLKATTEAT
jgi:hypothetical protein